jgi:hypothetical protein
MNRFMLDARSSSEQVELNEKATERRFPALLQAALTD